MSLLDDDTRPLNWNNGFWENGYVLYGKIHLDTEFINALKKETSLKSNIPLFHVCEKK